VENENRPPFEPAADEQASRSPESEPAPVEPEIPADDDVELVLEPEPESDLTSRDEVQLEDDTTEEIAAGNGEAGAPSYSNPYGFPIGRPVLTPPRLDEILEELTGISLLRLFSYLKTITMALPEDILADYLLSNERVQLEYLIDRLAGKPGIRDLSMVRRIRQEKGYIQKKSGNLWESFDYIERLLEDLPDQGFAVTMKNRMERIKSRFAVMPAS
jgi:hypothetical protein